jgi:hypothetical protein
LLEHARHELDLIGMTADNEDEMNRSMREHILTMIEVFSNEGHSGFSASYAVSLLTRLLSYKPLAPLTGADDEWNDVGRDGDMGGILYQNKRKSSVFKTDTSVYDIDGKIFWNWYKDEDGKPYKSYYQNSESRLPVTFPYTPEEPIYEYKYPVDDPDAPAQTEAGVL